MCIEYCLLNPDSYIPTDVMMSVKHADLVKLHHPILRLGKLVEFIWLIDDRSRQN